MPALCSFITPSVIRRGPLCIAISSSGTSPALSKTLRKEFEQHLPDELPKYLTYLSNVRQELLKSLSGPFEKNTRKRALLLKEAGSRKMLTMLKQKKLAAVKQHLDALIKK
jgi:siroheme synthase-like protein